MAQPARQDKPTRADLEATRTQLAMLLLEGALKLVRKEAQDAAADKISDSDRSREM